MVVVEIDPIKALEAVMDGNEVLPIRRAAEIGDIFVTVTGNRDAITLENDERMKSGAIVCNSGHFDVEIDVAGIRQRAVSSQAMRHSMVAYEMPSGKTVVVLAEGRLVNLAAAEGHPASVMDMSFANQALSVRYIAENADRLAPGVYDVPEDIDKEVARLKLDSLGVRIDQLTDEQRRYLASWDVGT